MNDLVTELEQANITCQATITFAESDFKDQLRMLRVRNEETEVRHVAQVWVLISVDYLQYFFDVIVLPIHHP